MAKKYALSKYKENGTLDSSFGGDGRVVTNFGSTGNEAITDLVVDSQDRIVVGGWAGDDYISLARYHPDGSLDDDFDNDGKVLTGFTSGRNEAAYALTVDSQDRPIAVGRLLQDTPFSIWPPTLGKTVENFALARYDTDGGLDTSFHGDGKVITEFFGADRSMARAVTVDKKDRVIVAGSTYVSDRIGWRFALARYRTDGSLDPVFATAGQTLTDLPGSLECAYGVAIDSAGRIVVAGNAGKQFAVVRYRSTGQLDSNFGGDGIVVTNFSSSSTEQVWDVAIDDTDRPVVAGFARVSGDYQFALARYDTDGDLDTSFDGDGKVLLNFSSSNDELAYSVAIDREGRIVTGGRANVNGRLRFALARHTSSGQPDTSFHGDGKVLTSFGSSNNQAVGGIAIAGNNSVIAGGWTES